MVRAKQAPQIDRDTVTMMARDILRHTQSEEGGKLAEKILELFKGEHKGVTLGAVFLVTVAIFGSMDESLRRPAAVALMGMLRDCIDKMGELEANPQ